MRQIILNWNDQEMQALMGSILLILPPWGLPMHHSHLRSTLRIIM